MVPIYKGGGKSRKLAESYRPISLTNATYKIYATILQQRLAESADDRIRQTQYGFRKNKSTSNPIFIMRRIMELHERQKAPLHAIFLDWSKAFDKILDHKLLETLVDLKVDKHLAELCTVLYKQKTVEVHVEGQVSDRHEQGTGIRQVCPFSPYLFLL